MSNALNANKPPGSWFREETDYDFELAQWRDAETDEVIVIDEGPRGQRYRAIKYERGYIGSTKNGRKSRDVLCDSKQASRAFRHALKHMEETAP